MVTVHILKYSSNSINPAV